MGRTHVPEAAADNRYNRGGVAMILVWAGVTYGSPMEMYLWWASFSPISTAFLFEEIFVEYILQVARPGGWAYNGVRSSSLRCRGHNSDSNWA